MLTILGYLIAGILLLGIVVVVMAVWLTPSDPFGTTTQLGTAMMDVNSAIAEQRRRTARELRLMHLDTDIRHARRLMDLEAEARGLQARYARNGANGRTCSPDVEVALHGIFDEIETLKRGAVS